MKKICIVCGKEFETHKSNKKCCSPRCSYQNKVNLSGGQNITKRETKRNCVICGKSFTPKKYNQICCSVECRKERNRIKTKELRQRNKEMKVRREVKDVPSWYDIKPPEKCKQKSCFTCPYPDCKY